MAESSLPETLAAYSAHRGEVFLAAAGVSKIYRYDVLQATWSSVPLTGESPPETLLAITWRKADRSVYILGTATVLGKTWIRLYQASLDGALTLRGSWLSTGSAFAYSLAVLPHQELVLLGSLSKGYTGAFLLDADTVEVTPVQEVWVYGTLHPFVAAVPERRALGYFASDSKKGVSPMTAPWSWWYAPYPGDLQYLVAHF